LVLPSFEVRHELSGLLDISQVSEPPASCPIEVLPCLISVQMVIALSGELERLVSDASAHLKPLLEGFLGLQLIFLNSRILGIDLAHLQAEVTLL
jgi:hypothetical protein